MSKGSGGTRAGSSGNPRGLGRVIANITMSGREFVESITDGWRFGEDSLGAPAVRKNGEEAAELYFALSSPVERAVESRTGDIRSGGGFNGPMDDRQYTIIFRNGTSEAQIRDYLTQMKTGARLYAKMNDRTLSDADYRKAEAAFDRWYNRTNKAR